MPQPKTGSSALFNRIDALELQFCLWLNRPCHSQAVQRFFSIISRLGNGVIWYVLMASLPFIDGNKGLETTVQMGMTALAGLLVYKILKDRLVRERPYFTHPGIKLGTAPLDKFSFPSGHTLHAVGFSIIAISYYPVLAWFLIPFTVLTAMSRIVLGLHYPTDVLAGAAIGTTMAWVSFHIRDYLWALSL